MIIVRFHGGLGNQMFQYAFYQYMEKKYPGHLKADITWFERNYKEHQGYELEKVFGIQMLYASYEEIARVHQYFPRYYPFAFLRYLSRKNAKRKNKKRKIDTSVAHIFDFGETQYRKNETFDDLDINKDWYIEGVFCSDEYLVECETKVKAAFSFPKQTDEKIVRLQQEMEKENSVAIHVRRGDYVGTVFDVLSSDYYRRAIELINEHTENPKFYIFSDDMEYIRKEFSFLENYTPVHNEGKASYTDMMLISGCKHAIIANSSFSYWGAVLGEREGSIVIAPKKYKADEEVALARKNWILM